MNHVKTYNTIEHNSFLRVITYSLLGVMIHTSTEQEVDGKNIILKHQPMREQNAFPTSHISPNSKLEPMEYYYFCPKLNDATVYNYSKQEVKGV